MLLLFLFVLLFVCLFLYFCFFFFVFKGSNMTSIGIIEFRYYVVIIIVVNSGKPQAIRDLGNLDWSAFSEPLSLKQVCGFQTWIFIVRLLHFVFCIVRISDQRCLGVHSQSKLLDRILRLHSYQSCWYWLGLYNLWRVKQGSLNNLFLG